MKKNFRIALGLTVSLQALCLSGQACAQAAPPPWDTSSGSTPSSGDAQAQQEGQGANSVANPFEATPTPQSENANVPQANSGAQPINPAQNSNSPPSLQNGAIGMVPGNPNGQKARNQGPHNSPQASSPQPATPIMGMPLGLEQKAWDNPSQNIGPGQKTPGTKIVRWYPGLITPLNLRQDMLTTIQFPEETSITTPPILSDTSGFEATITNNGRSVTLRPIQIGIDANVQISDDDGNTYIFYLRSQPWDYKYIPDVYVPVFPAKKGYAGYTGEGGSSSGESGYDTASNTDGYIGSGGNDAPIRRKSYTDSSKYDDDISARLSDRPRALGTRPGVDYAAHANTGNGRIRADVTISIPRPEDAVIAPIAAWRDDKFMFLDFGPRASSMLQWPVAKVVVDGVESPVQTQVTGPDRSILIVKAIGNVVLRNRSHIVCLKIPLVSGDPRAPALEEVYQDKRTPSQTPVDVYDPNARIPLGATPAGTGDYIDPRAAYTGAAYTKQKASSPTESTSENAKWPGNGSQAYHITTGPYDMGVATLLATEIGQGYRGNTPASANATIIPAEQVSSEKYGKISGPQAWVNVTAGSPVLAKQLCNTLKTYNHSCTLH